MKIIDRPFSGEADLCRMREMIVEARASGAPGCWHVGDLIWRYFLVSIRSEPAQAVRLWEGEDGRLLGFAWIDSHNHGFDWQVRPEARWRGVEDEALRWVAARDWQLRQAAPGSGRPLLTGAMADDDARAAFLEQNGFRREGAGLIHMTRGLDDLPQAYTLPPGFSLRAVAGLHEAAARAAAHRQAFHPSRVDDASYARLMGLPGYRPEHDLIALAPDGQTVAAFALIWMDEANRIGEFEPVGTTPAYRRLGLSRALLAEGLRRMRQAGATQAIVATWADSAPARALYMAAGMGIVNHEFDYVRSDEANSNET